MKKIVDTNISALDSLLGKRVLIFCMRYNYSGILSGVNDNDIELSDAQIVFDTGAFTDDKWACAETPKSDTIYVRTSAIESYVSF